MSIVKNLSVSWPGYNLNIPEWNLLDNGVTGLFGPSGIGKTTIARILLGSIDCPGLSWHFEDQDIFKLPLKERRLGVVFQDLALFPHMTAERNIKFAAESRGFKGADADNLFREVVEALGIDGILQRKAHVLSGGEKQRVSLARALVGRPRYLFLDEPFSALDADNRDQARQLLKNLLQRFQVPALLITHDREDIKALANIAYEFKDSLLTKREISSL